MAPPRNKPTTSTSGSTQPSFPLAYRLFFTYLDPVLSAMGVGVGFLAPDLVVQGWIPATVPNRMLSSVVARVPNLEAKVAYPSHLPLFHQLAGFFAMTGFLSAVLLRVRPRDYVVWRLFEGAIAFVDIVILASTAREYARQGRLWNPLGTWRPEDWFSVIVTTACAVWRVAFVAGVGISEKMKTA